LSSIDRPLAPVNAFCGAGTEAHGLPSVDFIARLSVHAFGGEDELLHLFAGQVQRAERLGRGLAKRV